MGTGKKNILGVEQGFRQRTFWANRRNFKFKILFSLVSLATTDSSALFKAISTVNDPSGKVSQGLSNCFC